MPPKGGGAQEQEGVGKGTRASEQGSAALRVEQCVLSVGAPGAVAPC